MGNLWDLMEVSRGKYRAFYGGNDLGELASPPEIKADYESRTLLVHDPVLPSRTLEGKAELHALITLKLRAVSRGLELLSSRGEETAELLLKNGGRNEKLQLNFPCVRLLPSWEFIPSFAGEHIITLKFSALMDQSGRLFYFSGT